MHVALQIKSIVLICSKNMRYETIIQVDFRWFLQSRQLKILTEILIQWFSVLPKAMLGTQKFSNRGYGIPPGIE
jgi:hypothetical protein